MSKAEKLVNEYNKIEGQQVERLTKIFDVLNTQSGPVKLVLNGYGAVQHFDQHTRDTVLAASTRTIQKLEEGY